MPARSTAQPLPLPRGWTKIVNSAVLHALSLAATALTAAWSSTAAGRSSRHGKHAELDRLRGEIAQLTEELEIKDARWARVPARRRPFYGPVQRMRILQLRTTRGWSAIQTADRFLVTEETIASWIRRLDEGGERALVQTEEPVNKFPDFVAYLVRQLKLLCPALGKVRIAQMLARAGLHLGATTVGRMLRRDFSRGDVAAEEPAPVAGKVVTAKRPNHIWHVDLTTVPTNAGFWVPWMPFSKHQRWPFSWWMAIVVDHASRLVVGFAVFKGQPTSAQVASFLSRAIKQIGATPKYIIADKGTQFFCASFTDWCQATGIRPRYGAVGKHGSIAIIERFIRSMKSECTRKIIVPFRLNAMRHEVGSYATWYYEFRPHSGLGGSTPLEVFGGLPPANGEPRFEPRSRWPRKARCAAPNVPMRRRAGGKLRLVLSRFENRAHLPVVELRRAA